MTPLEHARKFYGARWGDVFSLYLSSYYVYSSPDAFIMAKPEDEHWWVEYASGDLGRFLTIMPFWLPYVMFKRRDKLKIYATATLTNKIFKDDPAKDGFVVTV